MLPIRHPVFSLVDQSFSGLKHVVEGEVGLLGFLGPLYDLLVEIVWGICIVKNLHESDLEVELISKAVSMVIVVVVIFMLGLCCLVITF